MARWRLTEGHYLAVEGNEWEYKETNRETGRQARKVYEVPMYLNPNDASDWNYPQDEAVIVSNRFDSKYPRDIVFRGPPTPHMEPLDDEAKDISDAERANWINPIESINMSYSESRLSEFERSIAEIMAREAGKGAVTSLSLGGVSVEDFNKMQQQIATLMEKNSELEKSLGEAPKRRL